MSRTRPSRPSTSTPTRLPLERFVTEIDAALDGEESGSALLRLSANPLQIAHLPLDGEHPIEALLGFTAPPGWLAIGVYCRGRAYAMSPTVIDDADSTASTPSYGISEPTAVVVTALIDRRGRSAGLMRHGSTATWLSEPPEGLVGDACRRALGLPTPPPPSSTAELWLRQWLDRIANAILTHGPDYLDSWDSIAALHPAAPSAQNALVTSRLAGPLCDPSALAESTLMLADVWSWERLRHEPEAVGVDGPPLSRELAAWMDDGMLARVLLADLAPLPLLAKTVRALLPRCLVDDIDAAILATGLHWAGPREVLQ